MRKATHVEADSTDIIFGAIPSALVSESEFITMSICVWTCTRQRQYINRWMDLLYQAKAVYPSIKGAIIRYTWDDGVRICIEI